MAKNKLENIGDKLTFTKIDFTSNYFDKENDLPYEVTILNNMIYGALLYDNKLVTSPFVFNIQNVEKLQYMRLSSLEYTEDINFKTSDNNLNKLYSDMATMTISVNAKTNVPPIIGNNSVNIDYGEIHVFNSDDFTTNTTPPYYDAEGNPPYKLKILSLPTVGFLQLNRVNVTLNQEILFTDIERGLLTVYGNNSDIDGETFSFNFTISDTGSQIFA